ncbi:hypothetical protein ACIQMY_05410 [Streptomyces sp. NPDC091368]|uniref:hypothetical protein n=1 Tax=Streptomyces sp. NPDC091368 TaxID=3365993 RepID=UPI00380C25E5
MDRTGGGLNDRLIGDSGVPTPRAPEGEAGTAEAGERTAEARSTGEQVTGQVSPRPGPGPIMTGDLVDGRRVLGFGHHVDPLPRTQDAGHAADRLGDRLLLDGDEHASGPPERSIDPTDHPTLVRAGRAPNHQLDDRHVPGAGDIDPGIFASLDGLLYGPEAPGYLGNLVDRLASDGHGVWLAGGAPRDLVAGGAPEAVRDLDATGTAPAGVFLRAVDAVLALDGDSAELPPRFSPRSLVCSVLTVHRDRRTLEYRGLGLTGLPYPATGTDLKEDARQRDLTVNTLLYDPVRQHVLDPLGHALADLGHGTEGPRRHLRLVPPGRPEDPVTCAELLLRAAKFLIRWETRPGLDTDGLLAWVRELPADLPARIDARDTGPDEWLRLATLWEAWVPGGPTTAQGESLRAFGPAASGLLDRLSAPDRRIDAAPPGGSDGPETRDTPEGHQDHGPGVQPAPTARPDRSGGV